MMTELYSSWGDKMVFAYTKMEKFSMGNRAAYRFKLTDVQDDSTSVLRTPFKKITGWLIENISEAATTIRVVTNTEKTATNNQALLTLDAGTDNDDGNIIVVGLL